uniref:Uncharacterized protein n=1 Tax=Ananas comosus var. bracteatus TaxID=296719 RepID=A0A6V7P5L4_ANACO|nr:unnamed protein product [Ananas comosus var. bracteatus]
MLTTTGPLGSAPARQLSGGSQGHRQPSVNSNSGFPEKPRSRVGFWRVSDSVHSDPIARFDRLDFVVNPWSIVVKQNRSFVVSEVLIALVQSVRKSDGRICGDHTLIEERSVLANG